MFTSMNLYMFKVSSMGIARERMSGGERGVAQRAQVFNFTILILPFIKLTFEV